jgi:predicted secreted Zn-dependent protease
MVVMDAVRRHPANRRVLHAAQGKQSERVLQPLGDRKAAMRQQAMIAQINAQIAKHMRADNHHRQTGP